MKTKEYNPSQLEVELSEAIIAMKDQINEIIMNFDLKEIKGNTNLDNPVLNLTFTDSDGDPHQVVIKVIQRPDNFS